jgi:hypothetical protein
MIFLYLLSRWPDPITRVITHWFVHQDAAEGVDYDVARMRQVWDAINELRGRVQRAPAEQPGRRTSKASRSKANADTPCRSEHARDEPENAAGCQVASVIVDVHREHARSYRDGFSPELISHTTSLALYEI